MASAITPKNAIRCLRFGIGFNIFLVLMWFVFATGVYFFKYDIFRLPLLNKIFYYLSLGGPGSGEVFSNDFMGHMGSFLCVSSGFVVMSLWFLNDMKGWGAAIKKTAEDFVFISMNLFVVTIGSYLLFVLISD